MRSMGLISNLTDPGKSENVLVFARMLSLGTAPFEFLKMHLYQYTQKIELCSNKFDFLPLFCLVGLVPNSLLSGSRGLLKCSNMVGEAPSLQSGLLLSPPAMLSVKRLCLVWSTALAVLCVSSLVRLTSRHSKPSPSASAVRTLPFASSAKRSTPVIPASRCA